MKIRNHVLLIIAVAALIGLSSLVACGPSPAPPAEAPTTAPSVEVVPEWAEKAFPFTAKTKEVQYDLEILGAGEEFGMGLSVGLGEILTKYHPIIRASTVEAPGGEYNIVAAVEKDPNRVTYHTTGANYLEALHGIKPWEKTYPDQRLIAAYLWGPVGFITWDPKIKTVADLTGKTVSMTPKDDAITQLWFNVIEEAGVDLGTVKFVHLDWGANFEALIDKKVDVGYTGYVSMGPDDREPQMAVAKEMLVASANIYAVDMLADCIVRANQRLGHAYVPSIVGTGTWPLETRDVYSTGIAMHHVGCQAGADEDLIYEITKLLVQHVYELRKYTIAAQTVTADTLVTRLAVASEAEVHPGALKYYKEVGLWDLWERWVP
jgi:TRAP transporter TAXI family solute receptor